MSFTGPRDELLEAAIRAMAARGIIFVAAAGNEGPNASPSYPAAYPEVIAVTAIGTERTSYARANRGSYIDVAAPGVRIWTAKAGGGAGYESGTSFAAPYVAALVATLAGQRPGDGGAATKSAVLQRLRYEDLGAPGPDRIYGRGLVLAPEACRAPKAPPATVASGRGGWSVTTIKAGAAR
jgi:subtilisin family serine protease